MCGGIHKRRNGQSARVCLICVLAAATSFLLAWQSGPVPPPVSVKGISVDAAGRTGDREVTQIVTWEIANNTRKKILIESILTNCGCTVVKSAPQALIAGAVGEFVTERRPNNAVPNKNSTIAVHVRYRHKGQVKLCAVSGIMNPS